MATIKRLSLKMQQNILLDVQTRHSGKQLNWEFTPGQYCVNIMCEIWMFVANITKMAFCVYGIVQLWQMSGEYDFVLEQQWFPLDGSKYHQSPNDLCFRSVILAFGSVRLLIYIWDLQRLQKLLYLHLFTDCFMKIPLQWFLFNRRDLGIYSF